MGSDITDTILTELRALMNDIADNILTVRMGMDDYRFNQGQIESLAKMERYILDLQAKEHDQDEDGQPVS